VVTDREAPQVEEPRTKPLSGQVESPPKPSKNKSAGYNYGEA